MKKQNSPIDAPHFNWKGNNVRRETGHKRAQKLYPELGLCQECGKPAKERHHIDGITTNNDPSNIMKLCRRCHMVVDGRLDRLAVNRFVMPVGELKPCINCQKLSKPLRKGLCHTCNEYKRKFGIDRPYKIDGRAEKFDDIQNEPCKRCTRPRGVVGRVQGEYCKSCAMYFWRQKKLKIQPELPFKE